MSHTTDALRSLARRFEADTGQDSIDTMETHYRAENTDALVCVMPHCKFRRTDPYAMFQHVHFGNHGLSYGMTFEQFTALALSEVCPEREHHGNPFRYCPVKGCGWMEGITYPQATDAD